MTNQRQEQVCSYVFTTLMHVEAMTESEMLEIWADKITAEELSESLTLLATRQAIRKLASGRFVLY